MDRKSLLREIGERLRKAREPFKYSRSEMGQHLGAYRSSYFRYETGETAPQITSLYRLADDGISLDWLIANKGPMFYTEKEQVKEGPLGKDVDELLEYMQQVPLLRHEVLVLFYKFKDDHKGLLEGLKKTKSPTE